MSNHRVCAICGKELTEHTDAEAVKCFHLSNVKLKEVE